MFLGSIDISTVWHTTCDNDMQILTKDTNMLHCPDSMCSLHNTPIDSEKCYTALAGNLMCPRCTGEIFTYEVEHDYMGNEYKNYSTNNLFTIRDDDNEEGYSAQHNNMITDDWFATLEEARAFVESETA